MQSKSSLRVFQMDSDFFKIKTDETHSAVFSCSYYPFYQALFLFNTITR